MSTVPCHSIAFNTEFPSDAGESQAWYDTVRAVEDADDSHRADLNAALARILSIYPLAQPKLGRSIEVDSSFTLYPVTNVRWYVILYGFGPKGIFGSGDTLDEATDCALAEAGQR